VLLPVSPRPTASRSALARAGAVVLLTGVGLVGLSTTASADPQVTVTDESGTSDGTVTAGSVVTVSGSGFQSVQGGAGGIYVVFGWVDDAEGGTWRPSNGGATGADYLYAPDTEDADNAGFQRFVAFPGSGTAAAANGGVIAEDGTWSTPLTLPAAQFDAMDRAGDAAPVDCTQVQCGVITFGAHGIKNATNETFTPLTFTDAAAETAAAEAAAAALEEQEAAAALAEQEAEAEASASASTEPTDAATTEAPTPAPADTDDDALLSPSARLALSIAGGVAALTVLVVLGIRKIRAREAAATQSGPAGGAPEGPADGTTTDGTPGDGPSTTS
jgi:hypothetical protein